MTAAPPASTAPPAQTAPTTFPDQIASLLDIHKLRNDCRENHRLARRRARAKIRHDAHRRPKRGLQDYMIAPGTNWCGVSHRRNDLGPFSEADRCCRRHDKCKLSITGFSRNYNQFNFRPFTISHCKCDRRWGGRRRRDMSDWLRVPGTEWCGRGHSARGYAHLGPFSEADRCCRTHDTACHAFIPALTERYGHFNWRVQGMPEDGQHWSSKYGWQTFFNLVQTKCFIIKREEVCVKNSWWGKCLRVERRKVAHIQDNLHY